MKAYELMDALYGIDPAKKGCDQQKAGNKDVCLSKVAVTCMADAATISRAADWGAELLITHEPLFYNNEETVNNDPVSLAKKKLIDDTGITIYRYHDRAHLNVPDEIALGELEAIGLDGKFLEEKEFFGTNRYILKKPVTARELATLIEKNLNIAHVRICGAADSPVTVLATCFGTPAGRWEELTSSDVGIVLTGEACEWQLGEYARDAAILGYNKALLIMGHIGSERDGMKYLANRLKLQYADAFETKYFDCGEVYTYSEK